ncbi:hypothetical protein L3V77_10485 [Vibrio sp. DW001]|uniref:hypothetical protein n=1 Tax=Vibrio sp. DW001 TaxID=2912315 RepID=UPI0023AF18FF|nr:hypothetical protein [Vibrio sp. DW001]WED25494.1 hypothetical protein L3V77_10485 [Vibrio sp. DW001]
MNGLNYRIIGGVGFDSVDATILSGIEDRDTSIDMGINGDINIGSGMVSVYFFIQSI